MKVKQLIERLKGYPENSDVYFRVDYPEQEYKEPYVYCNSKGLVISCKDKDSNIADVCR